MACSQDFAADPRNANANRQAGNLARSVSDRAHCAVNHCANASINSCTALTGRWRMFGAETNHLIENKIAPRHRHSHLSCSCSERLKLSDKKPRPRAECVQ